jgi:D-arginine dehydrogenase
MQTYDVIVVGGGIAGVSIGYELAADRSVCLLEMESTLAFHTTGRSAATFLESYGGPTIRALTIASRAFFEQPPDCFESSPLSPLSMLYVGRAGAADAVMALYDAVSQLGPDVQLLSGADAEALNPILRRGVVEAAMLEPGAMELDVHAVHQGYVRGLRRRDGVVRTSAKLTAGTRRNDVWTVEISTGEQLQAPVLVNAAGAWCDEVAGAVGAAPVGIQPLLRTIFMVAAPEGLSVAGLPLTSDIGRAFYLKPEGNQFLCSPSDETPHRPADVRADELAIARALDAINETTTIDARHVRASWGGLRNFVSDRVPVVGFDPEEPGLFWFAGQGGYGIQTAPTMARAGAALIRIGGIPAEITSAGVDAAALAPGRLRPVESGS